MSPPRRPLAPRYGMWTVVEGFVTSQHASVVCDCGTVGLVRRKDLKRSKSTCCRPCSYAAQREPLAIRFERLVDRSAGVGACHPWIGALEPNSGYGIVTLSDGTHLKAHRVAWALVNGPIPEGALILHSCPGGVDMRCCVNHRHLRPGDHAMNARDMIEKADHGSQKHWTIAPEIFRRRATGETQKSIAIAVGIPVASVNSILRRRSHPRPEEPRGTHNALRPLP